MFIKNKNLYICTAIFSICAFTLYGNESNFLTKVVSEEKTFKTIESDTYTEEEIDLGQQLIQTSFDENKSLHPLETFDEYKTKLLALNLVTQEMLKLHLIEIINELLDDALTLEAKADLKEEVKLLTEWARKYDIMIYLLHNAR